MNINSVRNFLQWLCYRIRELLIKIKSIATFQICEARWRGTGDRKIYHKLFTPRVLEQYSVFGKQKSNFSCSLRILFFSRKNTDNFLVKAISSPEGVWSERNFFSTHQNKVWPYTMLSSVLDMLGIKEVACIGIVRCRRVGCTVMNSLMSLTPTFKPSWIIQSLK